MKTVSSTRRVRRPSRALLAAALLLSLPAFAAAPASSPAPRIDLRALATAKSFDRFIVKFRDGSGPQRSPATIDAMLGRAADRAKSQFQSERRARGLAAPAQSWQLRNLRRLGVGADVFVASEKLDAGRVRLLLTQLAADPDVEYVEIDQVLHASMTPNDTSYAQLWGLTDADAGIRADKAWDLNTGGGAVVAVIDTGYTDHSDLAANILPGYDFITDPTRANDGGGRDADAHDPGDFTATSNSSWHGTHVSGTIAAVGNNAKGIIGAAFGAKILPVRVLGVNGGDGSDIADAITWASGGSVPGAPANPNPAEVLNLSLGGGGGCSATYQNAINGAVSRGSIVVVAAGNENLDANSGSLSTCTNVVVVGAHTSAAARSSFSNYGAMVDVTAPGSTIYSTINTGTKAPGAEGYTNYQGTSMATPHVAATAALAQSYRVARGLSPYTPSQLEAQLKATSYPLLGGCVGGTGSGVVDARTLLDTADGAFTLLSDGVAQNGQAASTGSGLRYAMVTTTKAQGLTFSSSGGSGNADLYVKFGSAPTTSDFDCSSTAAGNGESCSIASALPGTYYVLLQAASGYSSVSLTGSASGNRKPVANFGVSSNGLTANFTDGSSDSDGGVTSRNWKFGDGSSGNVASPSHAYNLAGAYTVQFTATDGGGASNCALKQVNVNPNTVALSRGVAVNGLSANIGGMLTYTLAVPAGASNLVFNTSGGTGDADLYVKFGSMPTTSNFDCVSGSPTTTESCTLPSATAGTWYVLVHAFSKITNVSLTGNYSGVGGNSPPTANFSFSTNALTANFTDSSSDSDGSIASRSWNFGDGSTSTATNPSHTYASGGTYTVQLSVTDNQGSTSSTSKQVTVASGGGGGGTPTVSIVDAVLDEGNSLSRSMTFKLQLSAASTTAVRYSIATSNGTATAGSDYTAKSQVGLSMAAGVTT
jgi:serine protease